MENKNDMSKNIIIIILMLMIIGLAGLMCYDKFVVNKEPEKTNTTEKKEEKGETNEINQAKELSTESEEVKALLNKIRILEGDLYQGKAITNYQKIQLGLTCFNLSDVKEITVDEMDKAIKSVLGPTVTYKNESTWAAKNMYDVKYDNNSKKYIVKSVVGDGDFGNYTYYDKKVTKAIRYSDRIEIYENAIYVIPAGNEKIYEYVDVYKASVPEEYVDGNGINKEKVKQYLIKEKVPGSSDDFSHNIDLGIYLKQAETFKYTFTKDTTGNYYFTRIEKVNK